MLKNEFNASCYEEYAGGERIQGLNQEITDLLFADASDAPRRLGAECSVLYDNLIWAQTVKRTLGNGLEDTVKEIQAHRRGDCRPAG